MSHQVAVMRHASVSGHCQHAARVAELEAEVAVLKRKLRHLADRELAQLTTTTATRSSTRGGVPAPPSMQRYIQAKRRGATNEAAMDEARR